MKRAAIALCWALSACGPLHDVPGDLSYAGMKYNFGPFEGVGSYKTYYGNMIDITVLSNFNYQNYIIKNNVYPDAVVSPCDLREGEKIEYGMSSIYRYDGGYVRLLDGKAYDGKPPYEYHLFVSEHDFYDRRLRENDQYFKNREISVVHDYDLRADPRDICFKFNYASLNYSESSNTVRIPKEELLKLFALGAGR